MSGKFLVLPAKKVNKPYFVKVTTNTKKNLKLLQKHVEGLIEGVPLRHELTVNDNTLIMLCNESGLLENKPENDYINDFCDDDDDKIHGNVLCLFANLDTDNNTYFRPDFSIDDAMLMLTNFFRKRPTNLTQFDIVELYEDE